MKKISSFLLLLLLLSCDRGVDPNPDTGDLVESWSKTYGGQWDDVGYSVCQTSDGGFIIAGRTKVAADSADDAYFIRTNANGDTMWTKTFGGDRNDAAYSVLQKTDGGFIFTGKSHTLTDWGDAYVVSTDAQGEVVWEKHYGYSVPADGQAIIQVNDGYIITGGTSKVTGAFTDLMILKIDNDGNEVWVKSYGGSDADGADDIQQTSDGGYIAVGFTASTGAGGRDVYCVRTDAEGNELWSKTFGGIYDDLGYAVDVTADNGFIIVGCLNWAKGDSVDYYLIRLKSDGAVLWEKNLGGDRYEMASSVLELSDGSIIVGGGTRSSGAGLYDASIMQLNSNGDLLWEKTYGGPKNEGCACIKQLSSGGFILAGNTQSSGAGGYDVYVIRLDYNVFGDGDN